MSPFHSPHFHWATYNVMHIPMIQTLKHTNKQTNTKPGENPSVRIQIKWKYSEVALQACRYTSRSSLSLSLSLYFLSFFDDDIMNFKGTEWCQSVDPHILCHPLLSTRNKAALLKALHPACLPACPGQHVIRGTDHHVFTSRPV